MAKNLPASYPNAMEQICQEIQRFESVHPCIYAVYDLVDSIPDALLAHQIRQNIVCIEDSFVNSQEWTLSRGIADLKLGVVGSINSGKSSLVHRFLTGSYMQEESPEGGRFKKEITLDGQPYLLLIRDEGGPPEQQFTQWIDAVMFVFSLENEASFNEILNYHAKMSSHRILRDVPLILVGTQDAISTSKPRLVDDAMAQKLTNQLGHCAYYETCATYGLNVERVFRDSCLKIVNRGEQHTGHNKVTKFGPPFATANQAQMPAMPAPSPHRPAQHVHVVGSTAATLGGMCEKTPPPVPALRSNAATQRFALNRASINSSGQDHAAHGEVKSREDGLMDFMKNGGAVRVKSSPGPAAAVVARHRRLSGDDEGLSVGVSPAVSNHSVSSLRQWTHHQPPGQFSHCPASSSDYMECNHGKEIYLGHTTVKLPGRPPSGSQQLNRLSNQCIATNGVNKENNFSSKDLANQITLTAFDCKKESKPCDVIAGNSCTGNTSGGMFSSDDATLRIDPLHFKKKEKKHTRRSNNSKGNDFEDTENNEFMIVSINNKQWLFESKTVEERDQWKAAIEQQILCCLQSNSSNKSSMNRSHCDADLVLSLKTLPGNAQCADCCAPDPDWASLSFGTLICIECSGVHRNLGSHVSKVRSLNLDEWPLHYIHVMQDLGNDASNSIWESNIQNRVKPAPNSPREVKSDWIRAKYEAKEFLDLAPIRRRSVVVERMAEAICKKELKSVFALLAQFENCQINAPLSFNDLRTPLHLACAVGCSTIAQLLIWHNANVHSLDHEGRTPMWFARNGGSTHCVEVLLNSGCADEQPTRPLQLGRVVATGSLCSQPRTLQVAPSSQKANFAASIAGLSSDQQQCLDDLPASVI